MTKDDQLKMADFFTHFSYICSKNKAMSVDELELFSTIIANRAVALDGDPQGFIASISSGLQEFLKVTKLAHEKLLDKGKRHEKTKTR